MNPRPVIVLCAGLFFAAAPLNAQNVPDAPAEQGVRAEPAPEPSLSEFSIVDSLPGLSVPEPVLPPFDLSDMWSETAWSGTTKPRAFISTNLVNLLMGAGNLALEVRSPRSFAFKLSVVGSARVWPMSGDYYKISAAGFNSEARWYFNRNKTLYFGAALGLLVFTDWSRPYDYHYGSYVGSGPWEKDYSYVAITSGGIFGYYCRVSRRLAFDFNIGTGFIYLPEDFYIPIPMVSQMGVSVSLDLSQNPPPRYKKRR